MISSIQVTADNASTFKAAAASAATDHQETAANQLQMGLDQGIVSTYLRDGQLLGVSRQGGSISLNTHEQTKGDGVSLLSTAKTASGSPTSELTKNTLVSYGGMEITLQTAEQLGLVKQDKGEWVEVAPEDQPKSTEEGPEQDAEESLGENMEAHLGSLAEVVPPHMQTSLIESVIRQGLDATSVNDLAYETGRSAEELRGRIGAAEGAFRAQADKALMAAGMGKEDIPAFCRWAQENQREAFENAQRKHVFGRSTKDYAPLARAWMNSNAPAASSIPESLNPRTVQGETLVTIPGHPEMSLQVATRLGLI